MALTRCGSVPVCWMHSAPTDSALRAVCERAPLSIALDNSMLCWPRGFDRVAPRLVNTFVRMGVATGHGSSLPWASNASMALASGLRSSSNSPPIAGPTNSSAWSSPHLLRNPSSSISPASRHPRPGSATARGTASTSFAATALKRSKSSLRTASKAAALALSSMAMRASISPVSACPCQGSVAARGALLTTLALTTSRLSKSSLRNASKAATAAALAASSTATRASISPASSCACPGSAAA
mmetsp:Transcript_101378/g.285976  ORF Transcript_101378/g.285976 Transcript_101378/m.285976 type:complete len:242 (-) Transcript_101378:1078-1803(-)